MPAPETSRFPRVLRGVAEPLLALGGAIALTALLTVPFFPAMDELEVALRPQAGQTGIPHGELEERVEALGVARKVQVLLLRGTSRLVLTGVEDPDSAQRLVADLLEGAGYQRDEFERHPVFDFEALLGSSPRRLPIVMTIQTVIFSLAGLLLARGRVGGPLRAVPMSHLRALLVGVAAGLAALATSMVVGSFLEWVGLPVEEQAWLEKLFQDPAALLRISPWIVLIVPLSEEIFFRHYVFRFIVHHAGFPAGLIVSSVLFSLTHVNLSGLLVYLGIGCIFAWAYRRTGRLTASIAGHATLNAVVLIVSQVAAELDL